MKSFLKKLWKKIDGNKTIVCSTIWLAIESGVIPISPEWKEILRIVLGIATGGSAIHHVAKGSLKESYK